MSQEEFCWPDEMVEQARSLFGDSLLSFKMERRDRDAILVLEPHIPATEKLCVMLLKDQFLAIHSTAMEIGVEFIDGRPYISMNEEQLAINTRRELQRLCDLRALLDDMRRRLTRYTTAEGSTSDSADGNVGDWLDPHDPSRTLAGNFLPDYDN